MSVEGSRRLRHAFVALVLAIHAALALHAAFANFVTYDETGYIVSGISHYRTGHFSMYRVNPPLPRMIAVIPVLAARPTTDFAPLAHWEAYPAARSEFRMADDFVRLNQSRFLSLVRLARLAGVLWSLVGAWLVMRWAGEMFGERAGLLALVLWCFEPNLLAHAAVATPDVPCAVTCLAATYAFHRHLQRQTVRSLVIVSLLLGLAFSTKLTAFLLVPTFVMLSLVHAVKRRRFSWRKALLSSFVMAGIAIVVLDATYGFRGLFVRLGDLPFVSTKLSGLPAFGRDTGDAFHGNRFRGTWLGAIRLPVPEDLVRGIDVQRRDFEVGLRSYLEGTWKRGGFWQYYLDALALKMPLGLIVLFGVGVAVMIGRVVKARASRDEMWTCAVLLLPLLVVLVFVSSQTGFSHHMRYVLPLFPFVVLMAASVGARLSWARWQVVVPMLCAVQVVVGTARIHPHELSYFNELGGGPEHGGDHLVDSNIDWGQDLLALRDYLEVHQAGRPLRLAYFNLVPPEAIGMHYELPPSQPLSCAVDPETWSRGFGPVPGLQAVSVNYLEGAIHPVPDGHGGRVRLDPTAFEYFRYFRPIARAGYSIYVFDISLEEANRVRRLLELPPLTSTTEGVSLR